MKFAKELEQDAVPEWRVKYLNYKAGKKYVKAVARAANRANATPKSGTLPTSYTAQTQTTDRGDGDDDDRLISTANKNGASKSVRWPSANRSSPLGISGSHENESLTRASNNMHYGSIVSTPPLREGSPNPSENDPKFSIELPAPAMRWTSNQSQPPATPVYRPKPGGRAVSASWGPSAMSPTSPETSRTDWAEGRAQSKYPPPPGRQPTSPSQFRRFFSHHRPTMSFASRQNTFTDVGMQSLDLVREKENEFFVFLDAELDKVEAFYRLKEDQAGHRLSVLKDQLHEMRNRRIEELAKSSRSEAPSISGTPAVPDGEFPHHHHHLPSAKGVSKWTAPLKDKMFPPGPNSKAFSSMQQTPYLGPGGSNQGRDAGRDYIRRPESQEVPYRTAKRKLKTAMQEFYRELELLKSYALLNRTAFRKLNKKHDKAVNARPPYRYMNEKVNPSWFVKSDVLDTYIQAVEDLYARYFERGNHKLAAEKLRSLNRKPRDQASSTFQSGFLLGTGLVFSIQAVVHASHLILGDDIDPELRANTAYLLQIYGGYFLMLALFALFCVDCMVWTRNKVNYPFIFEFDQRHMLDWAVVAEFPALFFLLFGVVTWANFGQYGPERFFLYYPVILIAVTAFIILLPFPVLAHRARKWFAYSHWRLLLAGIYPVEFRDFFLGDMYCSLTYAMANLELFFCLYRHDWENPSQCNSNHSRLMGFLIALPPIWRFLQCLRRYRDTGNIFPHLVNGGKYVMTILSAIFLSVYRLHGSTSNLALFITFSLVNSFYTSIWDLFMDFSLIQAGSKYVGLRDILALKKRWPYYVVMVVDPMIRFSWIFYAIFTHDSQHSTIVSFMVSFTEVLRRGLWALFRVENEHCSNVSQYKASRDVPLPYELAQPAPPPTSGSDTTPTGGDEPSSPQQKRHSRPQDEAATHDDVAAQEAGTSTALAATGASGTVRQRRDSFRNPRGLSRLLAEAHKQDFVKRRRPMSAGGDGDGDGRGGAGQGAGDDGIDRFGRTAMDDDTDDDEDTEEDEHTREMNRDIGEARDLARRGTGG